MRFTSRGAGIARHICVYQRLPMRADAFMHEAERRYAFTRCLSADVYLHTRSAVKFMIVPRPFVRHSYIRVRETSQAICNFRDSLAWNFISPLLLTLNKNRRHLLSFLVSSSSVIFVIFVYIYKITLLQAVES